MSRFFIDRPVFAWVIALIIMLIGGIAVLTLPIAELPSIAPPPITISVTYPGASAETVQDTVIAPIEGSNELWRISTGDGRAQRLTNGNTLINEASFGRFFEVTAQGETVWEYVNPYFGGPPNAQTNIVFGVYRYTPEEIAAARSMG